MVRTHSFSSPRSMPLTIVDEEVWHNSLTAQALVVVAPHWALEGVEQDTGNVVVSPRARAHQARCQGAAIACTAESRQSHEIDLAGSAAILFSSSVT